MTSRSASDSEPVALKVTASRRLRLHDSVRPVSRVNDFIECRGLFPNFEPKRPLDRVAAASDSRDLPRPLTRTTDLSLSVTLPSR